MICCLAVSPRLWPQVPLRDCLAAGTISSALASGIGINPPSELALGVHLVQADLRTAPFEEQRLPGAGKMSRPPTTLQDDACTEI